MQGRREVASNYHHDFLILFNGKVRLRRTLKSHQRLNENSGRQADPGAVLSGMQFPPASRHEPDLAISRRHFLGACGALTMAQSGWAAAVSVPPPAFRLSTSSNHFRSLSIEEACRRIAALGFEGIDIWSAYESCPHLDDALERLGGQGLRELLARHRLALCSFSVYVGGFAKYAKLLGETGGGVAIQGSAAPCPPDELTPRMRAFLEELKPLVELAERHQARLAIENHGHALLDSLDSFKAFVDLNRSPHLGIALAPYHLQAGGASVEAAIRIAGSQLLFFYAWQNQPGTAQLPGHGPTEFRPWLRVLEAIGYQGYVNPFMHGHLEADQMGAALAAARDYLKERMPS
jgi:sugar phosphate isomerase/epimerase